MAEALTTVAGGAAVAAVGAVAVEDGPGLSAASSVFTWTGRTPGGDRHQERLGFYWNLCTNIF